MVTSHVRMGDGDEFVPVEIFAGEYWEASIIKEILKDNSIEVFLRDEIMGNILSYYVASGQ